MTNFCKTCGTQLNTDTGFCPMEQATMEIDDPAEAFVVIKTTLETLRRSEK